MKKLFLIGLVSIFSATAKASWVCTSQDVNEAAALLSASKKAMEAGQLHKSRFLETERVYYKAQLCAQHISTGAFCQAMATNLKQQLQIARQINDRAYFNSIFATYIDGMNALPQDCK